MTCEEITNHENKLSDVPPEESEVSDGILHLHKIESAMSVQGNIHDIPVEFLIDTGASCTLVSEDIFDKLLKSTKYRSKKFCKTLKMADGTPLPVRGILEVDIQLGQVKVSHDVIGAGIKDQGIIGFDFMKKHGCLVDIGACEFRVKGQRVPCNSDTEEVVSQVKETVELFPEAEQIIEVTLPKESDTKCLLEETIQTHQEKPLTSTVRNSNSEALLLHHGSRGSRVAEVQPVRILQDLREADKEDKDTEMVVSTLESSKSSSSGSDELNSEGLDVKVKRQLPECAQGQCTETPENVNLKLKAGDQRRKSCSEFMRIGEMTPAAKISDFRHSSSPCLLNWKKKKKINSLSVSDMEKAAFNYIA